LAASKLRHHLRLLPVGFDHALPADRLLDQPVERAEAVLLRTERRARAPDDQPRQQRHQHRRRQQRDQRQQRVEPEHHRGDGDQAQQPGDKLRHALREHGVDHLHVVGQPAHQVAVRAAVEKAQRQLLQAVEEIGAQVAHGALRRARHDEGLRPGQQRAQRVDAQHQRTDPRQQRQVARRQRLVDGDAEQVRPQHRQPRVQHDDHRRGDQRRALAA
jgi:hypothetical protein